MLKGNVLVKLNEAIINRINYYLKKNNMSSLWELYKSSGVPKSTINALLANKRNRIPRIPTLLHICEGLNTNLKDFFDDPIFLDVEDDDEDYQKKNQRL